MWLVVGLGNPGKEYASHRHNAGFMAVDELASRLRADAFRDKFSGAYTKASHAGEDLVLLKPMTFMNLSGQSVQPAAAFFKVEVSRLIVLHDELDVPFGEVRLKLGGGHAGHNGLRSIMQSMGSPDFVRLRLGIGRPAAGFRGEVTDWVLSGFDTMERAELGGILSRAADSVLDVLARGVTPAMNKLNTKAAPPKPPKAPRAPSPTKETAKEAAKEAGSPAATNEQPPRSEALPDPGKNLRGR